jgi:putative phosphoribosyl transferase
MYREALAQPRTEKALEIVPGPTRLFDEPGALERVALLTRDWFARHLVAPDDVERRRDAQ